MKNNPLLTYSEELAVKVELLCQEINGNSNTVHQIRKSSSSVFANITEAQYPQSLADMLSNMAKSKMTALIFGASKQRKSRHLFYAPIKNAEICHDSVRQIYNLFEQVQIHTFLLFLPIFTHLFVGLWQQKEVSPCVMPLFVHDAVLMKNSASLQSKLAIVCA